MTESDAREKWCPMVRFHRGMDGDVYCSRPVGAVDGKSSKCIASDCACWVLYRDTIDEREKKSEGHCGLIK